MRGDIAWFYAYDVAFEADLKKSQQALAGEPAYRRPGRYRKAPESVSVYSPLVLELAERSLPEARLPEDVPELRPVVSRVKLFAVGAVSIEIRMPFEASSIEELVPLREIGDDADGPIRKLASDIARDFVARARPGLERPSAELGRCETYTVLCVIEADGLENGTRAWLDFRRAQVAAFLLGERSPEVLSADQVEEALRLSYSYTNSDLAVVDWDAMVVVDTTTAYDELLYVAEVANLQMAELRTHDEALERAVDRAYEDIERYRRSPSLFRPPAKLAHALRHEMMDLAHIADEIQNLSKHFGDWYLARIYMGLRSRFHLAEWETQLERKLKTVSTMYEIIARQTTDRKMIILELMIVLLFVLDVLLVLLTGG
jgi:hypothetical protein